MPNFTKAIQVLNMEYRRFLKAIILLPCQIKKPVGKEYTDMFYHEMHIIFLFLPNSNNLR